MSIVDLHNNGDCYPPNCPACQAEEAETFQCEVCDKRADREDRLVDPTSGIQYCVDCIGR